jgi:hypothetical protein
MADAKLSELTAATSAAASDSTYLVQSATSKRITIANLFGTIATPAVFTDKVQIQGSETIASGAISATTNLTLIANPLANANLTMTSGAEGQIKIIIMASNPGGYTCTLSGSSVESTIVFDAQGDTATMIYTNSKWYFIGGTATIT